MGGGQEYSMELKREKTAYRDVFSTKNSKGINSAKFFLFTFFDTCVDSEK